MNVDDLENVLTDTRDDPDSKFSFWFCGRLFVKYFSELLYSNE